MLKKIYLFCILITVLVYSNNVSAQDKIAFIDLIYLFNNSTAGKKINDQIEMKTKKLNLQVDEYKKNINSEKETLNTQQNVIAEDDYKKKIIKIETDIKEFNTIIATKQNEISIFNNKAKAEFSKELRKILEEYSMKNSISIIIRKENLLIGKKNLDITKDILNLFNKNVKTISVQ